VKSGGGASGGGEVSINTVYNFSSSGITYQTSLTTALGGTTPDVSTVLEVGLHRMDSISDFLGEGVDFSGGTGEGVVFGGSVHATEANNPANGRMDFTGFSGEIGIGVSLFPVSGSVMLTNTVSTSPIVPLFSFPSFIQELFGGSPKP
jgi:hypothetical protein